MTVYSLVRAGQTTVQMESSGDRIVASLNRRAFEPESLRWWEDKCNSFMEGVILDIGGYTGLYTLVARKLGCKVLAFEPMAANRARFKSNCKFNHLTDTVREEAVSDENGTAELLYNDIPFTSGASLVQGMGSRQTQQTVKTVTIDSLDLQDVTLMKIDVERAEPKVLRGARETIQRCRPAILCEVLGEPEAAALPIPDGYQHTLTLDGRNWVLEPC